MTELLTGAEMREIERAAIAAGEVTGVELMERAGAAAVAAIRDHWPDLGPGSGVTVLCGPGNNGGDGFVIARLLAAAGMAVRVLAIPTRRRSPDAAVARRRWRATGRPAHVLTERALRNRTPGRWWAEDAGPYADLFVDAIFGIGLSRAPTGDLAALLRHMGGAHGDGAFYRPRLVAIDAPSGLDLDTGRIAGGGPAAVAAPAVPVCSLTVTFEAPKVGHFLADGPEVCGTLVVADLGLGRWRRAWRDPKTGRIGDPGRENAVRCRLVDRTPLTPGDPDRFGDPPPRFHKSSGHKYDHGHVLVVSGPAAATGAARLAARAALRMGAGLVTVASPPGAVLVNAAHLTAIMVRSFDGAGGLAQILEDARYNMVCLGPGLGVGEGTRDLVRAALDKPDRMVVLDADALTSFADDPQPLFDAIGYDGAPNRAVLTPHAGEFRRLFPDIAAAWQPPAGVRPSDRPAPSLSKVDAARQAAARSGAAVLLKGPDTVVADPLGRASVAAAVYDRAVPWLATAGAGDVLAGMIAGLGARQGLWDAVADAAWLHQECAAHVGPGLIAEDLPEEIPPVLRRLKT